MSYTKDDVPKIVQEYTLALRVRGLTVYQKQLGILEEVLLKYVDKQKDVKKKEEVIGEGTRLSGLELIQSFGVPAITKGLQVHACLLYGMKGAEKYTADDLFLLYERVREEVSLTAHFPKYGYFKTLPRDVKLGFKSFYHIEDYFMKQGRLTDAPFRALWERLAAKASKRALPRSDEDDVTEVVRQKSAQEKRAQTAILEEITREAVRRKPQQAVSVARDRGAGSVAEKYKKSEVEKPVRRDENVVKKSQTKGSKMVEDDDSKDEEEEDVEFMDVDLDEKW